jgi:uncharacterized protein DUF6788
MDCLSSGRVASSVTNFAKTFPKTPALVRHPVRCGRPNCRCARGHLHESWRLVWRDVNGKQRHRYVPKAALEDVRAIIARRRETDQMWRRLVADSRAQLKELRQWLTEVS